MQLWGGCEQTNCAIMTKIRLRNRNPQWVLGGQLTQVIAELEDKRPEIVDAVDLVACFAVEQSHESQNFMQPGCNVSSA